MKEPLRKRRWVKVLAVVTAALLVGLFIGSRLVGEKFRAKLAAGVHDTMGANLATGSVLYLPPYTFVVRDLRVTRPNPAGGAVELLQARGLLVKLAGFPKKGASPKIDHVTLDWPVFQTVAGRNPVRLKKLELREQETSPGQFKCDLKLDGGDALTADASANLDMPARLLQVTSLSGNGRLGDIASQIPWSSKLQSIVTAAKTDGTVEFSASGSVPLKDPGSATFQGAIAVDHVTAWVQPWHRMVNEGRGRILFHNGPKPAPGEKLPPLEASVDHFELSADEARLRLAGGKLDVDPLASTWRLAEVVGSVQLGNKAPLEVEPPEWFSDRTSFGGPVEFTAAASGPFKIPPGQSAIEAVRHQILAYPHDCWFRPRKFPMAIMHITGGPIACRSGVVSLQNLSGNYGKDKLLLRTARLTLEDPARQIRFDDLRTQFKYEEIAGTMIFARPNSHYPGVFGKTVEQLRPEGAFQVGAGSWYATNRPPKGQPWRKLGADLFIHLTTDDGSFQVTPYKLPLDKIHGDATISPLVVNITHFDARTMGGTAFAEGRIASGKPFFYDGRVQLRDLDLRQFGSALDLKGPVRARLSGIANANFQLDGQSKGGERTPLDALAADGEFEILRGDFWTVPPVHEVVTGVRADDDLGTGDAAGVFRIADKMITLQDVALNSTLIGLQGSGTVGFDKSIDLTVLIAPLGDWRDKMAQAGIPVVGDVLGAVQRLFNAAQGALLYQFRVTGTASNPVKSVVPAPAITQPLALLFGQMLRPDQNNRRLLSDVRAQMTNTPQSRPTSPGPAAIELPSTNKADGTRGHSK